MKTYSHSQLSQYLACPRKYRYRYVDGWREKDTRASAVFGRVFELALGALFRREDPAAAFWAEWQRYRDAALEYSKADTWDKMFDQAVGLLGLFAGQERVRIPEPRQHLQVRYTARLGRGSEFVAFIDGLGELDGRPRLLEWKTSSSRYPEVPEGLLSLDPQLVCYSWVTGIADVAFVVFVRKRMVEVQYLRTTIRDEQREEFGHLVENTIRQIESGYFLPHSGIRFPQNPCTTCPHLGLCLGRQELAEAALVRRPGEPFGLFDELT